MLPLLLLPLLLLPRLWLIPLPLVLLLHANCSIGRFICSSAPIAATCC
jgi:hypothetical protein